MNAKTTTVSVPWAGYDLSDPTKVFQKCACCDWKAEVANKKQGHADYIAHFTRVHPLEVNA